MSKIKDFLSSIKLRYYWIATFVLLLSIGGAEGGAMLDALVASFLTLFIYSLIITPKRIIKYRKERKEKEEEERLQKIVEEEETRARKERLLAIEQQRQLEHQEKMKYSIAVAGTSFRQDVIRKFVLSFARKTGLPKYENLNNSEIKDYGVDVYEYPTIDVGIVHIEPEPSNKYDKNALKISLSFSDETLYHVGYVAKEDQEKVRDWLVSRPDLNFEVKGGTYKEVEIDYNSYEKVYTRKSNYYITIYFNK